MKDRWRQLAARFDALTARERALFFFGSILGPFLLFHALVLDPLLARQQRLTAQLAEARQNIKTAENLIKTQETVTDPDAAKRTHWRALRKRLAEIDQNMQGLQKGLVPPERMATLLEEMLARGGGLQLLSLRTLPVQRFENPAAAPGVTPPASAAKPPIPREPERDIYQHSFEISLQGSYADLHDYLARLERLPWQMFWGRINLDTENHPRLRATLTLHTLSLNKAWLIV